MFGITAGYRQMKTVGFIGFSFSLLVAAIRLAGLATIPALRTMEPARGRGGCSARSSTGGCQGGPRLSVRNRVINPLVRALLRSPAHRVMSRGVLLLTYTGRRSGRRYTLPVQYARA